jgi:branched-chain amino acid transport system ATP-binding protein
MKLLELARALMGDPAVILLDEPAAGVNPSLARTLIERIEEINRRGTTFVVIEHDMDFVMRHCDPVIALAEGRVVFEGTADQARVNPLLLDAYLGAPA